jgi:hypothetical protein
MRFLCLYKPSQAEGAPPTQAELAAMGKLIDEMTREGTLLSTEGCQSSAKGARVRLSGGKITVTDGPFVETKEALGGYYVIDAPDLDTALAVAKLCPARFGGVEVRPVMTFG